jgi:hypothetical protein
MGYSQDQVIAFALSALAADRAATAPAISELMAMVENYAGLVGETYGHPTESEGARQIHRDAIERQLRAALAPSVPPVGVGREAEHGSVDSVERLSPPAAALGQVTTTLRTERAPDGAWLAHMLVAGLPDERAANAAMAHMQRLFCGDEIEGGH